MCIKNLKCAHRLIKLILYLEIKDVQKDFATNQSIVPNERILQLT